MVQMFKPFTSGFDSLNGPRANKLFFPLKHDGVPIYAKTFDPSSTTVNLATGEFTINDHFFNTGEELIYTPNSSFVGVERVIWVLVKCQLPWNCD